MLWSSVCESWKQVSGERELLTRQFMQQIQQHKPISWIWVWTSLGEMEGGECKHSHHSKGDTGRTENKMSCHYSSSLCKLDLLKTGHRHSSAVFGLSQFSSFSLWAIILRLFFFDVFHFKTLYWICSIKNQRADSLEKMLVLGKIDGKRRRGQQRMRQIASPTQRTWTWANSERVWKTEEPGGLQSMGSQRVGHNLATEQQQIELVTPIASTLCFFFFFFLAARHVGS